MTDDPDRLVADPPRRYGSIGMSSIVSAGAPDATDIVPRKAIVEIRQDWGTLPHRRRRREPLSADERLTRTLGALTPTDVAPVSRIGFDAALGAMADASKVAMSADLDCFGQWCAAAKGRPLPADPEDIVRYLLALDDRGLAPATLARRTASIAAVHRLLGLVSQVTAPMVRNTLRGIRRRRGGTSGRPRPFVSSRTRVGEGASCSPPFSPHAGAICRACATPR
ncbi:hypothetical protein FHS96_003435 [Sphingomonas zeicaulis]|uniref:hypothetical protein n=1 Tax=Sphingomonas zeicaulis TaxID=1632740 RepID=UPI003D1C8671